MADIENPEELVYRWQGMRGELLDENKNIAQFVFTTEGMIHLTVTDPSGCEYSDQIPVVLLENDGTKCTVSVPNVISPNGYSVNSRLDVFSDCDIQVSGIRLFDKWGGELHNTSGASLDRSVWEDLPPNIYMVLVTYETKADTIKQMAQSVMVIR